MFGWTGTPLAVRFRYLRDPLFLLCTAAYVLNTFLLRSRLDSHFLKAHFNDLLLIPCALPPILAIQRVARLRAHDLPPTYRENVFHLVVWALMAEVLGPMLNLNVADPVDLMCYALGALGAQVWWNRFV